MYINIIRFILSCFFYLGISKPSLPQTHRDTLFWTESTRLDVNNFKSAKRISGGFSAISCIDIISEIKEFGDSVCICVHAVFFPTRSRIIQLDASDYLLNHEQRHFDVAELFARRMRKKLSRLMDRRELDIYDVRGRYVRSYNKFQRKYDKISKHGKDVEAQEKMNDAITNLLEDTREYIRPCVCRAISATNSK